MSISQAGLSIRALRNLLLVALLLGVSAYTAVMFSFSHKLGERFGPQVRADLQWRVERGAQELARACDVGLVVGDVDMLKKCFGAHARSADVLAIYAVSATGEVVASHGRASEPVERLFSGPESVVRQGPGYLVSWASSTLEGQPVGRVALVVSTQRLSDATALLDLVSRTTLIGGVAALLLGVLVLGFFTRAVLLRDSKLSDYAANLERKVDERTRELDERNRGMRLVLDSVAQGFITIDLNGVMAKEHSTILDSWFGAPAPNTTFDAYLAPHAERFATYFRLNLGQLEDGFLDAEMVLAQMPKRFSTADRTFEVDYSRVGTEKLLLIVTDVTAQLARERAERDQKELLGIFQRILVDRDGVEAFVAEAARLLDALHSEQDIVVQKRLVHTVKGNAAMYGLTSISELAHQLETEMEEERRPLDERQVTELSQAWSNATYRVQELLGAPRRDRIELDRPELEAVLAKMREQTPQAPWIADLAGWTREPVELRFEQLSRQASGLARRLGKPEPSVELQANGVRLDSARWASFWSNMVHAVGNAMDHGLEDAETRAGKGKPRAGKLRFFAKRGGGRITIGLEDDGRGVDWDVVRAKAKERNLPYATQRDLVLALFADGLTTNERATTTSGRGVGLAALAQTVRALGGQIEVESTPGAGTRFEFTFPETAAVPEHESHAPRA